MFPILQMLYLDWFAAVFFTTAAVYTWYRIYKTDSMKQVDNKPTGKHLIYYLRRDNKTVPTYGNRAYPGESFLDIPGLGLMEFLGKDCYYNWGDKKYMWALENINFSPDPRYANLCHTLWELGFNDSDDVKRVLLGKDLELMGQVYLNMQKWDNNHGGQQMVKELQDYDGKTISFKPGVWENVKNKVEDKVDNLLNKKKEEK